MSKDSATRPSDSDVGHIRQRQPHAESPTSQATEQVQLPPDTLLEYARARSMDWRAGSLLHAALPRLQRTYGNQATIKLVQRMRTEAPPLLTVQRDHHWQTTGSAYGDPATEAAEIYMIYDQNDLVLYVGKTIQGADYRFGQHQYTKQGWAVHGYKVEVLKSDNWTAFETATWEQYYLLRGGGTAVMQNKINAITKKKFDEYKDAPFNNKYCKPLNKENW